MLDGLTVSHPRQRISTRDLTWAAAPEPAGDAGDLEHPMSGVITSLEETRARCRSLSDRAMVRAKAETLPEIPSAASLAAPTAAAEPERPSCRPSGFRAPESGPTDVVSIPTFPRPPRARRPSRG